MGLVGDSADGCLICDDGFDSESQISGGGLSDLKSLGSMNEERNTWNNKRTLFFSTISRQLLSVSSHHPLNGSVVASVATVHQY